MNIKAYHARVRALGCIVCRNLGYGVTPPSLHHPRVGQGGGQKASDWLVIPLCPQHHQDGGPGVALHAGQTTFERMYGTELDLLAQTISEVMQ